MGKKGRLEGDSGSITTQGKIGPQNLKGLPQGASLRDPDGPVHLLERQRLGRRDDPRGAEPDGDVPIGRPSGSRRDRGGIYLVQRPTGGHVD